MEKNVATSRTDITSFLRGSLVLVGLCALLGGCAAQHPATATQPDAKPPAPAATTATTTPPPAPQPATPPVAATVPPPATPPTPPTPPPPPPVLGFDEAVSNAAHAVFTKAPPPDPSAPVVVID